ncbi:MAG: PilZ domain-containing protein [Acidobacteriota bacterium]
MNRRQSVRHPRRVQVAFWKPGETAHSFSGYTTNISVTGMFIGTNTPLARGSRVRIEVLDQQRGFLVEAVVTHSIKAPQQLQAVRQSGMGVRLLKVEELIANFLEGGIRQQVAVTHQTLVSNVAGAIRRAEETAPRPSAPPPSAAPPAPPAPAPKVEERIFRLHFTAPEQFLVAFRREMQNGGLFVPAEDPAGAKSKILVEIHLPREGMMPLLLPAVVTKSYSSQLNHGIAGMAVEFEPVDLALAQLEKVFAILRNPA